jgi:hypothetical protein
VAGNKRSGARQDEFRKWDPSVPAPELDPSNYESILACMAWITREQALNNVDRADAREYRDSLKAIATVKKARFSEKKLEDLKDLVRQSREDRQRGRDNANAIRYGRNGKADECPAPNGKNSKKRSEGPMTQRNDT